MPETAALKGDDGKKRTTTLKEVRGRNRICKQCRFTCTDLKEFLTHQKFAHSQERDPEILESISKRRKSANSNSANIPKRHIRTNSAPNKIRDTDDQKVKSVDKSKSVNSEQNCDENKTYQQ